MGKSELSDPITLRVPLDVLHAIEAVAETCDRTRSWVIVRALRLYLASEGEEVLSIRRGRDQIAAGQSHDIDDVMRELETIVAGAYASRTRRVSSCATRRDPCGIAARPPRGAFWKG